MRRKDDDGRAEGPRTRALDAYAQLREDLLRGTLPPGGRLRIAELQARYGIGAIPLREALNRLCAEALVEKHEQRGFAAPPLDFDAYLDITNARLVVEEAALRLSVAARSRAWEDRLVLAFHRLSRAAPEPGREAERPDFLLTDAWAESHRAFHMALVDNCGGGWLTQFAGTLYDQSARYRTRRRQLSMATPPVRAHLVREHSEILDACVAGDADRAVGLLVTHYRRSVELVMGEAVAVEHQPLRFRLSAEPRAEAASG
jgi:GntR family carbon starvation induced transcriptional regulator